MSEASNKSATAGLEIMRVLVCSSAHVTLEEAKKTDAKDPSISAIGELPFPVQIEWEHGCLFYIGDAGDISRHGLSEGFAGAVKLALANGLEWIRFDSDGPLLPGVPTYHW